MCTYASWDPGLVCISACMCVCVCVFACVPQVYTAPLPKSFYSDTALSAAQDLLDQSVTEWETEYKEVRLGDYN